MKQFFKELFGYGHHINQQLFEMMNDNPQQTSEKAIKLFNHVINAHHIWNNRIELKQPIFGVWELHTFSDLKAIDQANYEQTLHILDKVDLGEIMSYTTSNGQTFTNNIRDILFHVVNHTTYHRGQIATEFKHHGLEPLATDYIFYKR